MIIFFISILACAGAFLLTCLFSRGIFGSAISPATVFCGTWSINFCIYIFYSENYDPITHVAWLILLTSFLIYNTGFYTAGLSYRCFFTPPVEKEARKIVLGRTFSHKRLSKIGYFIFFLGLPFFVIFIKSYITIFGLSNFFLSLLDLRAYMRDVETLPGFHFIYFWEISLAVSCATISIYGFKKNKILLILSLLATFSLLFTGAKTNIFKAVLLAFAVTYLIRLENINTAKSISLASLIAALGIGAFFTHTALTGEIGSRDAQNAELIMRLSAQFSTFDKLIHDPSIELEFGKLLFLPATKALASITGGIQAPSHILDFYNTPAPFNLATYLDIAYKDLGILGTLLIPWIFGLLSGLSFSFYKKSKKSLFGVFISAIFFMWTAESINSAGFIKPSYWFQIFFLFVVTFSAKHNPFKGIQIKEF